MNATVPDGEVRVIDTGGPPQRYARGRHCLGLVRDFADGKLHQVDAFGTSLVVFAGEDGRLSVLDAYCRHTGENLAQGPVKGDTISCPFHDWRWLGDGQCAEMPYARRIPPIARTRARQVAEVSGQLFVWHDPQGGKPSAELAIPKIPIYGNPGWTDWVVRRAHGRTGDALEAESGRAGVSQSTNYSYESPSSATYYGPLPCEGDGSFTSSAAGKSTSTSTSKTCVLK